MIRWPVIVAATLGGVLIIGALFARDTIHFFSTDVASSNESDVSSSTVDRYARITFDSVEVTADIADSEAERTQGLSGHPGLMAEEGLLFVFEEPGQYGFWMKAMLFPIDMLWLDETMRVVGLKENATPESFPEIFRPDSEALYVLEVNAGFAAEHGIKIGDQARLEYTQSSL